MHIYWSVVIAHDANNVDDIHDICFTDAIVYVSEHMWFVSLYDDIIQVDMYQLIT